MERIIEIEESKMNYINKLLTMTGEEIYNEYGLKRDETITYTANFGNGIEADIKLVICDDGKPYTEGVLFKNGSELYCTDASDEYEGIWEFEYEGKEYTVIVKVKEG